MAINLNQPTGGVSAHGGGRGGALVPSIVEYRPPEYDEQQVQAFQQEALAPGLGALRRSLQEAQAGRYSSPSERREALRGAVRGFGEALAPLQVGAGAQARQRYDIQYQQAVLAEQQRAAAAERALARGEGAGASAGTTAPAYTSRHRAFGTPSTSSALTNYGWFSAPAVSGAARRGIPLSTGGPTAAAPAPAATAGGAAPAYPDNWMNV
jgi:hypothetical protein